VRWAGKATVAGILTERYVAWSKAVEQPVEAIAMWGW
jgi:hypothetical protein